MIYPKFSIEKVNFLLDIGGLGDNIARMPAIKYVKNRHPHLHPIVWMPDYFIPVAKNMLSDIEFRSYSEKHLYDEKLPTRSTSIGWFTNLKTHMTQHAMAILANEIPNSEHFNYCFINLKPIAINKFNLPKKYVVLTVGFTAPIREWPAEYINKIADYVISKGYKVVFLGKKDIKVGIEEHDFKGNFNNQIDFSKGINLVDRTSLLEAAKIMNNAKVVLGVDNGLLHLAACTNAKIIAGFSSVDPIHRLPYRKNIMGYDCYTVTPPEDHPERYFQSIIDFEFNIDFRYSFLKNDSLIKSLSVEKWIKQLDKVL